MTRTVSELRTDYLDPPELSRPLAILHSVERILRGKAGVPHGEIWNPSTEELREHMTTLAERLKEMGFGGIVANVDHHNYLEDEAHWTLFSKIVGICRELKLRVWIYDELGYPSGVAGHLVLRDHPEYEAEVLVRSCSHTCAGEMLLPPPSEWRYAVRAVARMGSSQVDITDHIDAEGCLTWNAPADCAVERFDCRSGFQGTHATLNVHSVRRYINVLIPDAVDRFFNLTYQAYIDRMGDDLAWVEAFFTDEPSFMAAYHCELPERYQSRLPVKDTPPEAYGRLPQLPWRQSLPQDFSARWKYDILPHLRSLFEGFSNDALRVRHDFQQLISELYAEAFFDRIQSRLSKHGIPLSGHVLAEESIVQHVATEGDLMAVLRRMEKPGVDMLSSSPHDILNGLSLLACKYGSSAAHITGRGDIMSEVSDWAQRNQGMTADIDDRRGALAIQAALGITTFTSYYNWRDFEREDVRRLMDFCARLHLVVRHGTHVAPVAVLYPIRTAWAHYTPIDQTLTNDTQPEPLASLDYALFRIARALLGRQMDFDFIDSQALIESASTSGCLKVADESYQALVLPPGSVLNSADIDAIRLAADVGVRILAFEPLSEVQLPENREDSGESPHEVVSDLARRYPQTVSIADMGDEWMNNMERHVRRALILTGDTESVLVRHSRFTDGDVFLVVNASREPVRLTVDLANPGWGEIWNPADGSIGKITRKMEIEGSGARIIVQMLQDS